MNFALVRRAVAVAALGALVVRVGISARQSLWADEFFSLAMATGHSLEQPAAQSRPALGDFVEGNGPAPAAHWQGYLRFDTPPAGIDRVSRAVALSDTNPPLYYLALSLWLRATGTGDLALRLFSIFWAIAATPLIWVLARETGGERAAVVALGFYAVAPMSVYYSTEGRMYSMAWCLAAAVGWLTLQLHRRGPRPVLVIGWIIAAAAALLTHYFLAFVLLAMGLWLLLEPGRMPRWLTVISGAAAIAAVAPWYVHVPATLTAWRVTGDWLNGHQSPLQLLVAPAELALGGFGTPGIWSLPGVFSPIGGLLIVLLVGWAALRRSWPDWTPTVRLLLLWAAAAALGPVALDLVRHTTASHINRYALGAFPATLALVSAVLMRQRVGFAAAWAAALLLVWSPALGLLAWRASRAGEPYDLAAHYIEARMPPGGIVIVHGIPSSVVGIARYLSPTVPLVAWVGQLGERTAPADIQRLIVGRPGVAVVNLHAVGAPANEVDWLYHHTTTTDAWKLQGAHLYWFRPDSGVVFTR